MSSGMESFIEVDSCQRAKSGQSIAGDIFLSEKVKHEGRIVSVLSDGLGSGVKASVLATMTARMALKFVASTMDLRQAAEVIMKTLPICSVRQISYSTFTIVDMAADGATRIIEHGNPSFLLIRPDADAPLVSKQESLQQWHGREITYSRFQLQREDRIVFFSDGVTQAGMGEYRTPLGWGLESVSEYVRREVEVNPEISARELSRLLVARALVIDQDEAKDDITCGVVYFRSPRELLVITGPPFNYAHDRDLVRLAQHSKGRKVICGGTTANILARMLNCEVKVELNQARGSNIPPWARLDGFDLVTEGTLTLGEVARLLEEEFAPEDLQQNAAVRLTKMLLSSDVVKFAVGTRINEAHQDPRFPVELGLRRNIVQRIALLLENKYLKQVSIQYL